MDDEKKNNGIENEKNKKRMNVDGLTMPELKNIFEEKKSESLLTDSSILLGQKNEQHFEVEQENSPSENIQEAKPLYFGKNAVNNRLQEELETAYKNGELKIVGECIRGYGELNKDPVYEFDGETYIRAILENQDELLLSNGEKLVKGNSHWLEAVRIFSKEAKAFAEQGLVAAPEVMKMIQQYIKEEQGKENNNEDLSKE